MRSLATIAGMISVVGIISCSYTLLFYASVSDLGVEFCESIAGIHISLINTSPDEGVDVYSVSVSGYDCAIVTALTLISDNVYPVRVIPGGAWKVGLWNDPRNVPELLEEIRWGYAARCGFTPAAEGESPGITSSRLEEALRACESYQKEQERNRPLSSTCLTVRANGVILPRVAHSRPCPWTPPFRGFLLPPSVVKLK